MNTLYLLSSLTIDSPVKELRLKQSIWRVKFDTGQAELNIIILWPKQFDELTKATFLKPQTEILMHCLAFVKAYMVLSVKGGGGVRNTIR